MTRYIVIWRDGRGAEVARDVFAGIGRPAVLTFARDQQYRHPTHSFRILEETVDA
ncbi:hypothetical protein [Falsiroseomonas selenitidurans]|uniref:Uncharacterized protein n=1 Tax=Falsiroseomonas selenitidurans TaxID=2716335 RepID=A0ABX1E2X7_9PROT|nr:hypothetical protein [Falsiroseomonas selenitidurans]NKC30173.1 hypothetical protein [Falsiroseomonas selenitidurans]